MFNAQAMPIQDGTVNKSSFEISGKTVVFITVLFIGGMLLLFSFFPSSYSKQTKQSSNKKSQKPSISKDYRGESYDPGDGFPIDNQDERRRGAVPGTRVSEGSNQTTNDPVMAGYRLKYKNLRAINKAADRRTALLEFGRELARTDPARGLAFIKSFASDRGGRWGWFGFGRDDINLVCQGFFEVSAQLDLGNAITMAVDLPGQFRRAGLGTVMKTWAGTDLNAALAYIEKLPPDYTRYGVEAVFSVWGGKDPGAAMSEALKFKNPELGRMFETAVMSVLDGWSNVDPKSAWAYVLNPDESVKDAFTRRGFYLPMIAAKWAEKDLDAAMAAVKALNETTVLPSVSGADGGRSNQSYERIVEFMTMRLFDTDPEAAAAMFDREKWLAGKPWLSTRNVGRLIDEGSVTEAAEWMSQIPDKQAAFECARQLAARRTESDYDAVFKWANLIEDDYVKAGALSNVAAQQAQRDINRPIDWIYDLPSGYAKERSVAGYVYGKVRQTNDRELESLLRKQMAAPQIDMAELAVAVEISKMDPKEKIELMNLVEGRRPVKPLIIQ